VNAITIAQVNPAALAVRQLVPFTPWPEVLESFLNAACDSPETRRSYRRAVTACMTRLGVETLSEVSGAALAAFRAELLESEGSPSTHALYLVAVRSFLGWARRFGACALSPDVIAGALRGPRAVVLRPYSILSDPELAAVLGAAKTTRDRALVAVMAGAGLRVSEATGLDVGDVREDLTGAGILYVRHGKGGRDRLVPTSASVMQLVKAHLADTGRTLTSEGPLFRAHDRGALKRERTRLTAHAAGMVVGELVRLAGVVGKRISPHSLRHCYAVRYLNAGGQLVALATILGHASVTTTQRYADHLALAELTATVPALPTS
jgi:site-specific recombinase XerD